MKSIALAGVAGSLLSWGVAAAAPAGSEALADQRDPAHPRYADCAPPPNFAKRFPKLTLEKALKKVSFYINHESPSVVQPRNPVTGARVESEDLYAKEFLGIAGYGKGHTFTIIGQSLGGPKNYAMVVSNTVYTTGTKETVFNNLAELYVKQGASITAIPLSDTSEMGWCSQKPAPQPDSCFSTRYSEFSVDQALFEALANSDPQQSIAVTWKRTDGEMAQCPLYFSPLSFKSTLLSIDEAHAKAAAKREKQRAEGF